MSDGRTNATIAVTSDHPLMRMERVAAQSAGGLLSGGGELGALMRSTDWSVTPLGPIDRWPQSLLTMVSTCLNSRFPILIWWGRELVMLYNDAYRPMLGAKHPAALGAAGRRIWPEIWPIIGPMLTGVLERGEATWSEDQLLLLERYGYAEECYFTFSYSPIRDETGDVGGVFTAVTETTERVIGVRRMATLRALAEQTASAQSMEDAARNALDVLAGNAADVPFAALYLLDRNGRAAQLAGTVHATPGTLIVPQIVPLDDAHVADPDPVTAAIMAAVRHGPAEHNSAVSINESIPRASATGIANTALVVPVTRRGEDQPYGVLLTGISPHRPLDDAYRGFLDLVAGQVATAMANAQAYEAERQRAEALAELDRAKTAFFSNVSHEFRTPLTLLLGPAEDALHEPTTSPVNRERLEVIHRNALRLLRLVNTLLDFSRIEAGRIEAIFEPTELAAFTAELASTFRSAVEKAGLELVLDTPPLREPVYVDHGMWEKIVLNLLSNAFKHTFEGQITVSVRADTREAELIVRDTGIGIAEEQLPRLFERFQRVPNARCRTHEGSGIGLALVHELVELHGGRITVASKEGEGSTFTVRVPLGTAHLPAEHISEPRAPDSNRLGAAPFVEEALRWLPDAGERAERARAPQPLPAAAARLLVADDNADMREYVARLLRAQGWAVDIATDGGAALAAIRSSPPDLVLADVMMPGLDGFELLRAVRTNANTCTIPIILLSARAGEESRIEGLEAGADDYLVKPFSARELVARVRAHLGLAAARARAAAEIAAANASLKAAHDRVRAQSRATQEALAQVQVEQARLQQLFQKAPAYIGVVRGPDHVIELANEALRRLLGSRDVLGRPLREAIPEVEAQGFIALLDRVLATGEPYLGSEMPVKFQPTADAPAEQSFITLVYQPIVEADGSRSGVFMHAVDVTDQVRVRTEVEHARAEAEAARRAAEAANQTKSEFLAAMSHELRTPLNAIAGYTELLELGVHGPITEAQHTALDRIQQSGQHLLALINDVLNFAKLEAGRVEYHLEDLDLFEVVADVAPMIQPQLSAKDLEYQTRVPLDLTVRADRDKLQQILLNLLSNAIKFTNRGGRVTIDTEAVANTPPGYVWLKVSDTGIGIPREKQDSIFDPFVQVNRRLTSSTEGTGLGLSISRDLARAMGGDLFVQSTEGVGSTFTLSLPASPERI